VLLADGVHSSSLETLDGIAVGGLQGSEDRDVTGLKLV